MNISKLILLQKDLDAVVNKNHPAAEGEDRVANKFNALVVELAEFANEGRWFKYWSNDKEPRVGKPTICQFCNGSGKRKVMKNPGSRKRTVELIKINCNQCDAGYWGTHNPLLEEYVDSLHFFISIAIDEGWEKALYIPEERIIEAEEMGLYGGLTGAFNGVIYHLMKSQYEDNGKYKGSHYRSAESMFGEAWYLFIAIGLIGFSFSEEAIEAAYMSKNKENHSRQQNGY